MNGPDHEETGYEALALAGVLDELGRSKEADELCAKYAVAIEAAQEAVGEGSEEEEVEGDEAGDSEGE